MAGVWRRKTIQTVGGWQSRTTVEDMDLSLRAYVNGWKAIYLTDTTCTNEVTRGQGSCLCKHSVAGCVWVASSEGHGAGLATLLQSTLPGAFSSACSFGGAVASTMPTQDC